MTKVVYKNISQGCNKIRNTESKEATHPLDSMKVVLCDLQPYFILRKICIFIVFKIG